MLDIIKKVMEAEEASSRLVEAAREESRGYLADCRRRARDLEETSARKAALEGERNLAAAAEAAHREREERIRRAVDDLEAAIRLEEAVASRVAAAIVRCVCAQGGP